MDCSKRSARPVAALPDDPLVEILSRVPAKSVCRFKRVSKAWRDLITDPLHREKLPQAMEGLFFFADLPDFCGIDFEVRHLGFIDLTARSVPLDMDPCFSFLSERPEIQTLVPVDSCNGLMLLEHRPNFDEDNVLGYIVLNPTTKQWGTVPSCGCPPVPVYLRHTYLAFDRARSSHFHFVQFQYWNEHTVSESEEEEEEERELIISLHAYSSETRMWSHSQTDWDKQDMQGLEGWHHMAASSMHAFVNGMLHLVVWNEDLKECQMLVVDVQGKIQRMISLPAAADRSLGNQHSIAHSQGLVHDIIHEFDANTGKLVRVSVWVVRVSVWVLQDYDAKEWVRKDVGCPVKVVGEFNYKEHKIATCFSLFRPATIN